MAIRRYLSDGIERVMVPMWLRAAKVADLRQTRDLAIVWQDIHAQTGSSPTWPTSDAARAAGAQAMLYPCRTRAELRHVVIFDPDRLRRVGPDQPFP